MQKELVKIGYISKAHGFKGELKCSLEVLMLSDKFPQFIWIYLDGKPVPFFIEKSFYNKSSFIVKIEDIESEETAMQFKNTSIYCEKHLFDIFFEKEESLDDLIGFEVSDEHKGKIGNIISIIENSIQPTLVIQFEEKEILIPYSEDIIVEINEIEKTIFVSAPEGLIDMYLD